EFFADECNDLPRVAAVDVVDPFACDRRRFRIDLDTNDAARLPRFERRAERRFAATEFENRFRVRTDALEQIETRLTAHRAPAMYVIAARDHDLASFQDVSRTIVDRCERSRTTNERSRIAAVP